MSPIGKMFDILELTTLLADELSQHDLSLCCRVSKIFSPHLWHSITIHPNDPILKFQSPEGRAGLIRNGHHIRILQAYSPFALEPFVESGSTCTNLVSLDVNHSVDQFTGKVTVTRTLQMLSRRRRRDPIGAGQRQISRMIVSSLRPAPDGSVPAPIESRVFEFFASPESSMTDALAFNSISGTYSDSTGRVRTPLSALYHWLSPPASSLTGLPGVTFSSVATDPAFPTIEGTRSYAESNSISETNLISILERNPQLEFLVVPSHCLDCEAIVKLAAESLLSLKEFYSDTDFQWQGPTINFSLREHCRKTQAQTGTALEAVEGRLQSAAGKLLHPLLSDYPRLRELQMDIYGRVHHDTLERIRLADRRLTYLEMTHGCQSGVTQILMRASPLKHIQMTRDWGSDAQGAYDSKDSATKKAFLRHAPTLEHLETGACNFPEEILQALLQSSPSLRTLKTMQEYNYHLPSKEVELDALRVIKTPWICTQLEEFKCRILNVTRPDVVITPFDNVFPDPPPPPGALPGLVAAQDQGPLAGAMLIAQQESHAVQRRVLRQIGQLTHLRKLSLGRLVHNDNNPEYSRLEIRGIRTMAVDENFDWRCLELTLESGLDELSRLKQLKELWVYKMAHRIGLAEIRWMVENWPRLKIIGGLMYEDSNREVYGGDDGDEVGVVGSLEEDVPEHVKWIKKNRPDIQLC
ncbi:hypothetical protein BGZ47_001190 [Haplosporangium gracile]|nr:hypothetical protein BGZ47_001190 [Haplosporangium gracile]